MTLFNVKHHLCGVQKQRMRWECIWIHIGQVSDTWPNIISSLKKGWFVKAAICLYLKGHFVFNYNHINMLQQIQTRYIKTHIELLWDTESYKLFAQAKLDTGHVNSGKCSQVIIGSRDRQ